MNHRTPRQTEMIIARRTSEECLLGITMYTAMATGFCIALVISTTIALTVNSYICVASIMFAIVFGGAMHERDRLIKKQCESWDEYKRLKSQEDKIKNMYSTE